MPRTDAGSSRPFPRVLLGAALVLLAARFAACAYEPEAPPVAELVEWRPIAAAEAESRASGKPILYDFSAEWCGPCVTMQEEVFADRTSARILNERYVPVRVVDRTREEGRNPPDVEALQERFAVDAFPTLVVFSPATERREVLTGYGGRRGFMERLATARKSVLAAAAR